MLQAIVRPVEARQPKPSAIATLKISAKLSKSHISLKDSLQFVPVSRCLRERMDPDQSD